ncbi:uncharacterized protein LOC134216410 [Armigeres subalbatus]|uniref:uncharacterized protein LOC134216410 n=1 Tax=Armigeres subalbatus TaxID=124917 RepID=UPI002ED45B07
MATKRAFNILEQRNINENSHIGKSSFPGKNSSRAPFKSALKDLTNNSSSTRPNFTGKQPSDGSTALKKPLQQQQKPFASSVSRKKLSECNVSQQVTAVKKQHTVAAPPFPIFSPLDAEYSWGKEACLREDLLEQMIEYNGVRYQREIKPLKAPKMEAVELPELEIPRPNEVSKPAVPNRFPSNFLFNLQEVDIPDLEFMF